MTHDPLCTWRQAEEADAGDPRRWLAGGLAVCDCDLIAKVRKDERYRAIENAVNVVNRIPSGAVMEIACAACGWDCGHESDLAELYGAYDEHIDNCPALQEKP